MVFYLAKNWIIIRIAPSWALIGLTQIFFLTILLKDQTLVPQKTWDPHVQRYPNPNKTQKYQIRPALRDFWVLFGLLHGPGPTQTSNPTFFGKNAGKNVEDPSSRVNAKKHNLLWINRATGFHTRQWQCVWVNRKQNARWLRWFEWLWRCLEY